MVKNEFIENSIIEETPGYLTEQLITYIGNKRSLIPDIEKIVIDVKKKINKDKIRVLDAFSGSGVVARFFKRHSSFLATIDLENYSAIASRCYLKNRSDTDMDKILEIVDDFNSRVDKKTFDIGFIEKLYSPKDENHIKKDDRVFYTKNNARRLDNYRRMIEEIPSEYKDMILGPLLSEASVHVNTSGVFKGFYKDKNTKIGCFGGTNANALKRILGDVVLKSPILSRFDSDVEVFHGDTNYLAPKVKNLDIVYLDPPYNQHPYGSNYFMLNLLSNYKAPREVSNISGIPKGWNRSDYNVKTKSKECFRKLIESLDTKYIMVSFNNEGFISCDEMTNMLKKVGKLETFEIKYNTFRGCRNIKNRSTHVIEYIFLVETF